MGLVGGVVALDFANTMGDGTERLTNADDILDWALRADVIDTATTEKYRHDLHQDAKRLETLLRRARNLRDLLLSLGRALANDAAPENADLVRLRNTAAEALRNAEFRPGNDGGYAISFENGSAETAILGPIVWSAIEMLREGQFERVKQCPECGFLFFDRSKNNSRRWCDMATCGNRTKLRNFRERRR